MMRKRVSGNPAKAAQQKAEVMRLPCLPVRMAVLTYSDERTIESSCGWKYRHNRERVREDAADRHVEKWHRGKAIRL